MQLEVHPGRQKVNTQTLAHFTRYCRDVDIPIWVIKVDLHEEA